MYTHHVNGHADKVQNWLIGRKACSVRLSEDLRRDFGVNILKTLRLAVVGKL